MKLNGLVGEDGTLAYHCACGGGVVVKLQKVPTTQMMQTEMDELD